MLYGLLKLSINSRRHKILKNFVIYNVVIELFMLENTKCFTATLQIAEWHFHP